MTDAAPRRRERASTDDIPPDYAPQDYDLWLERLSATHDAVVYTCSHRLQDPRAAAGIGVQVIGGLLRRPGVFRYSGLPYSGAIARLAETRIAAARAGRLPPACSWPALLERLVQVPEPHRAVLVMTCVHGYDDDRLARRLGCSVAEAARRREETADYVTALAGPATPPLADP
ncbi:MAG TPA: hypothetical protein VFR07_03905 [Mycobacteriales bacterium]|jgi:hypothetical protein|nr:hypothetical protein [Mycobacteriales bacterium]